MTALHERLQDFADDFPATCDLDRKAVALLREAATALQSSGGEVVCYGLRRKGSTAIVGIIPNKVAQKPATLEWFNENYDEVPLCLASRQPETTAVTLCRKHGMYAKKGCADCDADIDMLTRIEPPDIASPAQPSDGYVLALAEIAKRRDGCYIAYSEKLRADDCPLFYREVRDEWNTRATLPTQSAGVEERWVVVRESVLDVGLGNDVRTGGKPELGYALIANAGTFESQDAARLAHRAANLPLGWVVMSLSQLLPDLYLPALRTPADGDGGRVVVTDEMVERAADAYEAAAESEGFGRVDGSERVTHLRFIRAAIDAALHPGAQP